MENKTRKKVIIIVAVVLFLSVIISFFSNNSNLVDIKPEIKTNGSGNSNASVINIMLLIPAHQGSLMNSTTAMYLMIPEGRKITLEDPSL